ncbi:hypothetical protein BDN72DRAFT_799639 [Pluteus cervinus]|uniref:Uncharacterized protein n=1 Tax=Pluteus cervinus TaxID=181527 RepID=A0ACD3AMS8_9AGAR|nr:hypothetical protein BDN72DRAFT_799639 [Pluteus cervinus]
MPNDVIEQAHAKIDAEILELEARILALRSSRNALTPAYRLPAELFSEIFGWIQVFWVQGGPEHLPKWTAVTHVCKLWREIALDCRTLWADIPMNCFSYVEEAIKRSRGTNLSLFDVPTFGAVQLMKRLKPLVLSASPRIRKLSLCTPATKALLPELVDSISQSLEKLELDEWHWATEAFFPKSLRTLNLQRCLFQWGWLELPRLTDLQIVITKPELRTSVASFLKLLSQMPLLTRLVIRTIFTEDLEDTGLNQCVAGEISASHFPRLHILTIQGPLSTLVQFISQIQLSEDFALRIQVLNLGKAPITELVQIVKKHLAASQHVIHAADFRRTGPDESWFSIHCLNEEYSTMFLQIALNDSAPSYVPWMKAFQLLPLDRLDKLSSNAFREPLEWQESIFRSLKELKLVLLADGPTSAAFLAYFIQEIRTAKDQKSTMPFFPSLIGMALMDVRFTREIKVGLKAALEVKMKQGEKLEALHLSKCKITDDTIKQLSKVVTTIANR